MAFDFFGESQLYLNMMVIVFFTVSFSPRNLNFPSAKGAYFPFLGEQDPQVGLARRMYERLELQSPVLDFLVVGTCHLPELGGEFPVRVVVGERNELARVRMAFRVLYHECEVLDAGGILL